MILTQCRCRICGDPGKWRSEQRQMLCDDCLQETATKVSRSEFDQAYWGDVYKTVPPDTRRQFYSDYLSSKLNLQDYIASTSKLMD